MVWALRPAPAHRRAGRAAANSADTRPRWMRLPRCTRRRHSSGTC